MKKVLKFLIIKLIEIIERIEYRNLDLDENDITKKIIESNDIDINVESDKGYVPATEGKRKAK